MEKYQDLRIIFMGTPNFAVASLEALLQAGCNIVAVVTAADKPAGRGMKMHQSPVKVFCLEHNLKVLQPEKLKQPEFIDALRLLKADLQLVVAFRMLPELVWNMPPMGSVNLHASLLPQYRGAAPINWAIINGEIETGVTCFKLQHEIDTGDILMQESMSIHQTDNAGIVHDKMKKLGAQVLVKTVKGLADGTLEKKSQIIYIDSMVGSDLKPAPKLNNDNCEIDFSKTMEAVYNLIRGLSPIPGAFTFLDEKKLKIFEAEKIVHTTLPNCSLIPGKYSTDKKNNLLFACSDGFIRVLDLQLEGKKRMAVKDFLSGYRFGEDA